MEANMGEYIKNYLHLKRFPCISLHCKLVPVQYWEYKYGLLKQLKKRLLKTTTTSAFVISNEVPKLSQWPTFIFSYRMCTAWEHVMGSLQVRRVLAFLSWTKSCPFFSVYNTDQWIEVLWYYYLRFTFGIIYFIVQLYYDHTLEHLLIVEKVVDVIHRTNDK